MQIVPLRFCHTGTKSVLWPSKYAKFRVSAGALPLTLLGEVMTIPRSPSRIGKETSLPIPHPTWHRPTFGARNASPRIPAIYAYGCQRTALFLYEICSAEYLLGELTALLQIP